MDFMHFVDLLCSIDDTALIHQLVDDHHRCNCIINISKTAGRRTILFIIWRAAEETYSARVKRVVWAGGLHRVIKLNGDGVK